MTDSHRKAAEEWVRERAQIEDRANWITVDTAHLAGQECGEHREHEAFLRFLRSRPSGKLVCFAFLAAQIERGEHRK